MKQGKWENNKLHGNDCIIIMTVRSWRNEQTDTLRYFKGQFDNGVLIHGTLTEFVKNINKWQIELKPLKSKFLGINKCVFVFCFVLCGFLSFYKNCKNI